MKYFTLAAFTAAQEVIIVSSHHNKMTSSWRHRDVIVTSSDSIQCFLSQMVKKIAQMTAGCLSRTRMEIIADPLVSRSHAMQDKCKSNSLLNIFMATSMTRNVFILASDSLKISHSDWLKIIEPWFIAHEPIENVLRCMVSLNTKCFWMILIVLSGQISTEITKSISNWTNVEPLSYKKTDN